MRARSDGPTTGFGQPNQGTLVDLVGPDRGHRFRLVTRGSLVMAASGPTTRSGAVAPGGALPPRPRWCVPSSQPATPPSPPAPDNPLAVRLFSRPCSVRCGEFAMQHAVIRCRTRLICQRHRGSTRPGPRPRPGLFRSSSPQGCLLAHPTAWLTPHFEALMHRHGRHCEKMHAWQEPLRTQEHRRCGRGGCGLPAAMSRAQCSFLPMGNALPSGTPEKHARRQSAADAR